MKKKLESVGLMVLYLSNECLSIILLEYTHISMCMSVAEARVSGRIGYSTSELKSRTRDKKQSKHHTLT